MFGWQKAGDLAQRVADKAMALKIADSAAKAPIEALTPSQKKETVDLMAQMRGGRPLSGGVKVEFDVDLDRVRQNKARSVIQEALDANPMAPIPGTPVQQAEDIVGDITSATGIVEDSITNIFKGEELDKMEAAEKRSEKYLSAFDKGLETHKETAATLEREIMAKVSELLDLRKVIAARESALGVLNAKPTPVPSGEAAGAAMKVLNNAVKPKVRTATRKRKPEPVELAA